MYALADAPAAARSGPAADVAPMTRRGDLVTIALATWLIAGLFLDGWAHGAHPELETFFTPWHAVFYSGFTAMTAWIGWLAWSRREPGTPLERSLPRGYAPAAAGIVLFSISGLGDLAWHEAFGIEQDVSALLSPSHLGLFAGALLIVTAPLRSLWSDPTLGRTASLARLLPAGWSRCRASWTGDRRARPHRRPRGRDARPRPAPVAHATRPPASVLRARPGHLLGGPPRTRPARGWRGRLAARGLGRRDRLVLAHAARDQLPHVPPALPADEEAQKR